jgi:hypothetical protein
MINEDTAKNNEIINPIDTFPSTNKFSGDYAANKGISFPSVIGKMHLVIRFLFILKIIVAIAWVN